jgi:hypothetical protein
LNVTVKKYVPGVKLEGALPLGKFAPIWLPALLCVGNDKESNVTAGLLPKF